MSKSLFVAHDIRLFGAGQTAYGPVISHFDLVGVGGENIMKAPIRHAGTFFNMFFHVPTNTCDVTNTATFRVNLSDTSITLAYSAFQTGEKEDTSNIAIVTATDEVNYTVVSPPGEGTITWQTTSITFDPTTSSDCVMVCGSAGITYNIIAASATQYFPLNGGIGNTPSETGMQHRLRGSFTASNLYTYVLTNARTTDTTFITRKNFSDGNQSVTYTSTQTGTKEDTSNTDSLVAGDDYNYSWTSGTGTGTLAIVVITCHLISTNDEFVCISFDATSELITASTTRYASVAGQMKFEITEADVQVLSRFTFLAKELTSYMFSNSASSDPCTVTVRANGADTSIQVSFSPGQTGLKTDSSNTAVITSGVDEINYEIDNTDSSGNVTFLAIGMLGVEIPPVNQSIFIAHGSKNIASGTFSLSGALSQSQESRQTASIRTAGRFYNLSSLVSTNTYTGTATVQFRKNNGVTDLIVTYSSTQTGIKEDTTNVSSNSNTDTVNFLGNQSGGSGVNTLVLAAIEFEPIDVSKCITVICSGQPLNAGGVNLNVASVTRYLGAGINLNNSITDETLINQEIRATYTSSNLRTFVGFNSRTTDVVIKTRINGSDGNQSLTVPGGQTGSTEDTSNTDSLVAGDDYNYSWTTLTGTENFAIYNLTTEFLSTLNIFSIIAGVSAGVSISAGVTTYAGISGYAVFTTTEAHEQFRPLLSFTGKELNTYVGTNSSNGTCTVTVRSNGADSSMQVSYSTTQTGLKIDSTNTLAIIGGGSNINYKISDDGSTGSVTFYRMAMSGEGSGAPMTLDIDVSRINADGSVQETSLKAGEQTIAAIDTYVFTVPLKNWASGNEADRIRINYHFRNPASSGTQEVSIETGTQDSKVLTSISQVGVALAANKQIFTENLSSFNINRSIASEHLASSSINIEVPIEWTSAGVSITQNQAIIIEWISEINKDLEIPVEWLSEGVSIAQNQGIPIEFLSSLIQNQQISVEFLSSLIKNEQIPVEFLLSLVQNQQIPTEWRINFSQNQQIPVEFLSSLVQNQEIPIEFLLKMSQSQEVPVEFLLQMSQNQQIPVGSLIGILSNSEIPVEWTGTILFVQNQQIPIEWLSTIDKNLRIPTEWLINLSQNQQIPTEFMIKSSQGQQIPVEYLLSLAQNQQIPVEWLGGVSISQNQEIPIEWIISFSKNEQIPVEFMITYSQNQEIPVEWGRSISQNQEIPIERIRSISQKQEILVEWIRSVSQNHEIPIELLSALVQNQQILTEWRLTAGGVSQKQAMPIEFLSTLAQNQQILTEWLANFSSNVSTPIENLIKSSHNNQIPTEWLSKLLLNQEIPTEWTTGTAFTQNQAMPIEYLQSLNIDNQIIAGNLATMASVSIFNTEYQIIMSANSNMNIEELIKYLVGSGIPVEWSGTAFTVLLIKGAKIQVFRLDNPIFTATHR